MPGYGGVGIAGEGDYVVSQVTRNTFARFVSIIFCIRIIVCGVSAVTGAPSILIITFVLNSTYHRIV